MLHADRRGGRHPIQDRAIKWPRDGFVVTHGPDPAVLADGGIGQHTRQVGTAVHLVRSDGHRRQCGGRGMQVDVVIVQAGDDGMATRVEYCLARERGEAFGYIDDSLLGTDVDTVPSSSRAR